MNSLSSSPLSPLSDSLIPLLASSYFLNAYCFPLLSAANSLVPLTNSVNMPPKFDPSKVVDVFVRVTDGEVSVAFSLAPKIGLLGRSPKKISEDITG
jgi:hypothetical protein